MIKQRICKDCRSEGRTGPVLNAPHPGPRCHRHHLKRKREVSAANAARRGVEQYNVTEDEWADVLAYQNGVCAWCLRPPTKRRLAKDHDHKCCPGNTSCGRCLRGGLCWTCNKFLEHLGDDPVLVHRGWEYLTNPPARLVLQAHTK